MKLKALLLFCLFLVYSLQSLQKCKTSKTVYAGFGLNCRISNECGIAGYLLFTNIPLINPNPLASFGIKKDMVCQKKPALFTSPITGSNTCNWNFGNGTATIAAPFTRIFTTVVSLEDEVMVNRISKLFIPDTFTLNVDTKNDVWQIAGRALYPKAVAIILNRYGQNIFESHNCAARV